MTISAETKDLYAPVPDETPAIEVARLAEKAKEIGHWRRLLHLYGGHRSDCTVFDEKALPPICSCGFERAFD